MRKVIALVLTYVLVLSAGCGAKADTPSISEILDDQIIVPDAVTVNLTGLKPGSYVFGNEVYYIENGDTNLHIENCLWTSETQAIQIGFYNVETYKCYGRQFTGGTLSNFNITSVQIPTGRYKVYVKNSGTLTLETGTLKYSFESVA